MVAMSTTNNFDELLGVSAALQLLEEDCGREFNSGYDDTMERFREEFDLPFEQKVIDAWELLCDGGDAAAELVAQGYTMYAAGVDSAYNDIICTSDDRPHRAWAESKRGGLRKSILGK